jgi:DNA-binding CsgD family transcriptional regulator
MSQLLTPKEIEVMRWLLTDKTQADIAKEMCTKEQVIKNYSHRIYEKFEVRNRIS